MERKETIAELLLDRKITLEKIFENDQVNLALFVLGGQPRIDQLHKAFPQLYRQLINFMLYYNYEFDDQEERKNLGAKKYQKYSMYALKSSLLLQEIGDQISNNNVFDLLKLVFKYVKFKEKINDTVISYFEQIISIFRKRNIGYIWEYLQRDGEIIYGFMEHLYLRNLTEILFQFLNHPISNDPYDDIKQEIIKQLINKFCQIEELKNTDVDSQIEENISELLFNLIVSSYDEKQPHMLEIFKFITDDQQVLKQLFKKLENNNNNYSIAYTFNILKVLALEKNPQIISTFQENIKLFSEILNNKNLITDEIKTSHGENIKVLGSGRINLIQTVLNLVQEGTPIIIDAIIEHNILFDLLNLVFIYKWNNMLHNQVLEILKNAVNLNIPSLTRYLFFSEKINLVQLIIQNYRQKYLFTILENSITQQPIKKGNSGFLSELAIFLYQEVKNKSVTKYLQSSEEWQIFVEQKLLLVYELFNEQLGEDQDVLQILNIENKWLSKKESTSNDQELVLFKKMSTITNQKNNLEGIPLKKSSEKFIVSDPTDPREILMDMAINGCGRKNCTNQYCIDNPLNEHKISEAYLNRFIREGKILNKVIYTCDEWEQLQNKNNGLQVDLPLFAEMPKLQSKFSFKNKYSPTMIQNLDEPTDVHTVKEEQKQYNLFKQLQKDPFPSFKKTLEIGDIVNSEIESGSSSSEFGQNNSFFSNSSQYFKKPDNQEVEQKKEDNKNKKCINCVSKQRKMSLQNLDDKNNSSNKKKMPFLNRKRLHKNKFNYSIPNLSTSQIIENTQDNNKNRNRKASYTSNNSNLSEEEKSKIINNKFKFSEKLI